MSGHVASLVISLVSLERLVRCVRLATEATRGRVCVDAEVLHQPVPVREVTPTQVTVEEVARVHALVAFQGVLVNRLIVARVAREHPLAGLCHFGVQGMESSRRVSVWPRQVVIVRRQPSVRGVSALQNKITCLSVNAWSPPSSSRLVYRH